MDLLVMMSWCLWFLLFQKRGVVPEAFFPGQSYNFIYLILHHTSNGFVYLCWKLVVSLSPNINQFSVRHTGPAGDPQDVCILLSYLQCWDPLSAIGLHAENTGIVRLPYVKVLSSDCGHFFPYVCFILCLKSCFNPQSMNNRVIIHNS